MTTFTKLLQCFPQSPLVPEAKLRLGTSLVAQKRHAKAEPHFVQAAAKIGLVDPDAMLRGR